MVDVVVPVYYPDEKLTRLLQNLALQTIDVRCVRIISTGKEGMQDYFEKQSETEGEWLRKHPKVCLTYIDEADFDYAETRNLGFRQAAIESGGTADLFVVSMTQDAVPCDDNMIEELLKAFKENPSVAVGYARQVPFDDASIEEKFTRFFNYPEESREKKLTDVRELGIKTYFNSNVCSMYRMDLWTKFGGFDAPAIFNEDMVYASKIIKGGFSVYYAADAKVFHSHNYNAKKQFSRNFDLGVSQKKHPEVFDSSVSSSKEGIRYVRIILSELWKRDEKRYIPRFIYRCFARWCGYQMGKHYELLPISWVVKISNNKNYWEKQKS